MLRFGTPKKINQSKVLVIDDEPDFSKMLKLNLESNGDYIVETLNESTRAVDVAISFEPDVILLDVVMPKADGGDVATSLREHIATQSVPIIFVSAMVSKQESNSGFYECGGEYFLAKPVKVETLRSAIETLLAQG